MSTDRLAVSGTLDFSFLDRDDFKVKYTSDSANICFFAEGIHCEKCVRKLENLVGDITGLRRLRVEMGKNLIHVEIDPAQITFAKVAETIESLGFRLVPLAKEQDYFRLAGLEDRNDLIRLAVSGACAGNIMTFAFANYFGADMRVFAWLSFLLYLPVVIYVAVPFYQGGLRSMRQRRISIDLPMAVASLAGFIFSTVELLRGRTDIYFDSLSGFLFLILLSRWVQKRLQRKFLSPGQLIEGLCLDRVRIVTAGVPQWHTLESLRVGDTLKIEQRETLPADAELKSNKAYFSLAWLSGETKAKTFIKGALVPAGARLMHGEAQLTVRKPLAETEFGKVLSAVQKFSLSDNRTVQTSDRWAQRLLALVFACAIVFLIFYWRISPEQAIERAISLLIIACPCAMAFGTPLAFAVSLKKARQAGLIIRDAKVFEAANFVRTICFDKTGTLTDTDIALIEAPTEVSMPVQQVVLALENASLHPMAFAFRRAFWGVEVLPVVEGLNETPGCGVAGRILDVNYELKRNPQASSEMGCTLFGDGHHIQDFHFSSREKTDSSSTLAALRRRGLSLLLLSGDKAEVAEAVGLKLGFQPREIYFELSPSEKADVVAGLEHVMMVGDGINDSLALMRADIGVAVSGGVESALKSASVYLTQPGIAGVNSLLLLSQSAFSLIRQNLMISAAYNLTAGSLALLGYVNPFVAAILMPISSGFILLTTWLRSRE